MRNILITSAGRRAALVKAFQDEVKSLGVDARVFSSDMFPELSSACRISDGSFKTPPIKEEHYIQFLLDLVIEKSIGVLIPTIDTELTKLSESRSLFREHNCDVLISDRSFIDMCQDKRETADFFHTHGIDTPKEYKIGEEKYPVFIKPFNGSRSMDTHLVSDESEMKSEYISNPRYILQEYIDPTQFYEITVDAYYGRDSILKCLIPRKRIEVRDGEVSKGLTIRPNFIEDLVKEIETFKGVRGCLNFQFFVERCAADRVLGIEINPRFGGGFPLSYRAGGNFPGWIIQEYLLDQSIDFCNSWRENTLMLRFDDAVYIDGYTE